MNPLYSDGNMPPPQYRHCPAEHGAWKARRLDLLLRGYYYRMRRAAAARASGGCGQDERMVQVQRQWYEDKLAGGVGA